MFTLRVLAFLFVLGAIAPALAADPGLPLPSDGISNGQKPGSVLFFSLYSSGFTSFNVNNTRIVVTNTNQTGSVTVRLLFVDGLGGNIDPLSTAEAPLCLAPNQTASFLASDIDPYINGYVIALAIDARSGCPVSDNHLIGHADVKLLSGHIATLPAQTIAARFSGTLPGCDAEDTTAALTFDGSPNGYDQVPRVLAVDKFGSRMDGDEALIVINRIGGNVAFRVSSIGYFKGSLFDETGNRYDFTDSHSKTQLRFSLSDGFPIFAQTRFSQLIPSGSRGWMKFWAQNESALFGAMIKINATGFNGGQNLRALTMAESATLVVPLIPASC